MPGPGQSLLLQLALLVSHLQLESFYIGSQLVLQLLPVQLELLLHFLELLHFELEQSLLLRMLSLADQTLIQDLLHGLAQVMQLIPLTVLDPLIQDSQLLQIILPRLLLLLENRFVLLLTGWQFEMMLQVWLILDVQLLLVE